MEYIYLQMVTILTVNKNQFYSYNLNINIFYRNIPSLYIYSFNMI